METIDWRNRKKNQSADCGLLGDSLALLIGERVLEKNAKNYSLLIQKGFGEKRERELVLDLYEALLLLRQGKIKIENVNGENVEETELLKHAGKKKKSFLEKFVVYEDFRKKGYVVRTGFKFGFDFRIYPKGKKPGEEHTKWVVKVLKQNDKFNMVELSRMVRLSANIHTILVFAIVDNENEVNYYEARRLLP